MKLAETIGSLVGLTGAVRLAMLGASQVHEYEIATSEYRNGMIELRYGLLFAALFVISRVLLWRGHWSKCVFIGILSTAFSILGLFSIGPYLIGGSLFLLVYSSIQALKSSRQGNG